MVIREMALVFIFCQLLAGFEQYRPHLLCEQGTTLLRDKISSIHCLRLEGGQTQHSQTCLFPAPKPESKSAAEEESSESESYEQRGRQVMWDSDEWSDGKEIKDEPDSIPDVIVPDQNEAPQTGEPEWTDAPCHEVNVDLDMEDHGMTVSSNASDSFES